MLLLGVLPIIGGALGGWLALRWITVRWAWSLVLALVASAIVSAVIVSSRSCAQPNSADTYCGLAGTVFATPLVCAAFAMAAAIAELHRRRQ